MRVITVHQPFASAIVEYGKGVENRTWTPPDSVIGETLAIHASKHTWMMPGPRLLRLLPPYRPGLYPHGAVIGVATLTGVCSAAASMPYGEPLCCRPWGVAGNFHWQLSGPVALPEPVPCRGFQRVWTLPPEVAEQVAAQLAEEAAR